jgi:hypothetical protein
MISAIPPACTRLMPSPRNTAPMIATSATPAPAQMAYATPTGSPILSTLARMPNAAA